jgi:hypothetical protein
VAGQGDEVGNVIELPNHGFQGFKSDAFGQQDGVEITGTGKEFIPREDMRSRQGCPETIQARSGFLPASLLLAVSQVKGGAGMG